MTFEFKDAFKKLTTHEPFKWQTRLYTDYFSLGKLPDVIDIPTGLGKTSIMAIWYLAFKAGVALPERLPRRLIYVVDRRAVVDQATRIAEQIKETSNNNELPVSTLRGQYVDNKAWLEDPVAPAIIVGTIDMIGSRLLFSGYGVSRKMRPYHAGLLGADTLIVLDESHLAPPFEKLLEAIAKNRAGCRPIAAERQHIVPPFKLLSLSATGQRRDGERFQLDKAKGDLDDPIVAMRLKARKNLRLIESETKSTSTEPCAKELAEQAWAAF